MVTKANHEGNWDRASYLELPSGREPQAIGALLPQVLARYGALPVQADLALEDRSYEDEEDMHTLAASTAG